MSLAHIKRRYFPRSQVELNLAGETAMDFTERGRLVSLRGATKVLWEIVTNRKFANWQRLQGGGIKQMLKDD